jgi:hypothetical protein
VASSRRTTAVKETTVLPRGVYVPPIQDRYESEPDELFVELESFFFESDEPEEESESDFDDELSEEEPSEEEPSDEAPAAPDFFLP